MSDHDIDPTSRAWHQARSYQDCRAQLKPSTLMMGHGYDPVLSEGSLKPPIFPTSTFAFPSAADGRHFEGIIGKRRAARTVLSIRASTRPIRKSSRIACRYGTARRMH